MMSFSNLHFNQNIIRGVKFHPQIICSCGCNESVRIGIEGENAEGVMCNLIGAYYEETQCEHVVGFLRTLDKEFRMIFYDTKENSYGGFRMGKKTPKQLGKTIEKLIKETVVHYIILAEEVREGEIVIVSNRKIKEEEVNLS